MDKMHQLKEWIGANTTQAQFARDHGISEGFLSEILAGKKEPKLGLAARMSRSTGGKVPLDAFVTASAAQ